LAQLVFWIGSAAAEARDLALLNDAADRLNLEAAGVLDYQTPDE